MADQTVFSRLTSVLRGRFLDQMPPLPRGERLSGWRHIRTTAMGSGRRWRSGERHYGLNGPQAVARRRRQIAAGALQVTQQ